MSGIHIRTVPDAMSGMTSGEYLATVSQDVLLRYGCISAAFMLVWDYVTSLDDEVAYIWMRKSGLSGRPLYYYMRYGGLAFTLYDAVTQFGSWSSINYVATVNCKAYYPIMSVGTLAFLYPADVLLAYRALCLWRMNRALLYITCIISFVSILGSSIVLAISISQFNYIPTPRYLTGCWATVPTFNWVSPLPALLFEFWAFGLVLARAVKYSRGGVKITSLGVVKLLMRDSMWWFSAATMLIVINALFLSIAPATVSTIFLPFARSAIIIFCCRIIIHMRRASVTSQQIAELQWQMSSSRQSCPVEAHKKEEPTRSVVAVAAPCPETQRIDRALSFAQRMGLPPALTQDLIAMWYDPVATLNQNTGSGIELAPMDTSSPDVDWSLEHLDKTNGVVVRRRDEQPPKDPILRKSAFSWDDEDATRVSFDVRYVLGDEPVSDNGIWWDDDDDLEGGMSTSKHQGRARSGPSR